MQVYGIFEGGGAKGLAHVGGLAVAQDLGVQFVGVAGASAGAIVAALVAVGYRAEQLYDPATRSGLLASSLTDHFGAGVWEEWVRFSHAIDDHFAHRSAFSIWAHAPLFYFKWRRRLQQMFGDHGFFDTAPLESVIDGWLRHGLVHIPAARERVLFSDLDPALVPPLRIIASDVDRHAPVVFSRERTPGVPIARAVAASIAIPFFFRPVRIDLDGTVRTLVDGALVANFPVWIFDDARRRRAVATPTIGFRLIEKPTLPGATPATPFTYARSLMETALNANTEIHARGVDDLYTFPIEVDVSVFEFDLSPDEKSDVYRSAERQAGYTLLRDVAPRNPRVLALMLKEAAQLFLEKAGLAATLHLRANLVLLSSRDTLRIVAGYNMDADADDRLEFELEASACGECWNQHEMVVLDIGAYLQHKLPIPGLSKYQAAMVRPTLATILSVPIFDPLHFDSLRPAKANPLIGVLNFDSDGASVADFAGASAAAREAAAICGDVLKARLAV